jgi:hypothetical protein
MNTELLAYLRGLAGGAVGLAALAVVLAIFGLWNLWRLRRDRLALEASARHEAVEITEIVRRHVPSELQSEDTGEEFPIALASIRRDSLRWTAATVATTLLCLSFGTAGALLIRQNSRAIAAARLAALAPAPVDALHAIVGTWGWKFDTQLSCAGNPHTISVADGGKTILVRFSRSIWDGHKLSDQFAYTVLGVEPNKLLLRLDSIPEYDGFSQPLRWVIGFEDADTYSLKRSDRLANAGAIVRCPRG